jgi:hypothetical protein
MTSKKAPTDSLVGELLQVLDEEISLLDLRCEQLEKLTRTILDRDNAAMEQLLDAIERAQQAQASADARLSVVRGSLAAELDLPAKELRLSGLAQRLPDELALAVDSRRRRIIGLANAVRRKNLEAAIVLSECARINHLLMQSLFPRESSVTTYQQDGPRTWRTGAALIDAER